MNSKIHILILILVFLVGCLFSEAYLTGPKKHFQKGRDAAYLEIKEKYVLTLKNIQ